MWIKKTVVQSMGVALGLACATIASADELTAAKKADLRTFVELTGAKNFPLGIANAETQRMAQGIRRADPKFPDKGFQIMRDNIAAVLSENAGKPEGLFDQLALVYHNHFSHEEVKELVRFHTSPTGKRLQELQGKIGQESMQTAGKWAGNFGPEIDKRVTEALKAENIKLPAPPQQGQAPATKAAPAKPAAAKPAPTPVPAPAAPK